MKGHEIEQSPAGAADGEAVAGKTPRRPTAYLRLTALATLGVLLGFAAGFAWFASHVSGLSAPKDPRRADAIIVLTGGQARLDAALDLLKSGKGRRLLISGVHPAADSDDLRAATGGDRKLFSCCVDIDHAALDTVGNALESAKWIRSHDFSRVILVTNNYHMPRSLLEMGRLLDDTDMLEPYPVVNTRLDGGGWMTNPDALRVLFTEYNKYLLALARGVVPLREKGISVANASAAE